MFCMSNKKSGLFDLVKLSVVWYLEKPLLKMTKRILLFGVGWGGLSSGGVCLAMQAPAGWR